MKIKLLLPILLLPLVMLSGQGLPDNGICAHRGASFSHPENTLAAFREAIRLGVQMIEFDVRFTKDSLLIVIHDKDLLKTTSVEGYSNEFNFDEIRKLDAGIWKGEKFKGEKIPKLEEVLDLIPPHIWMNIHIKDEKWTAIETAKILKKRDQIANAILAINGDAVDDIRNIDRNFKICCMDRLNSPEEYINEAIRIKADFIQLTLRELPFLDQVVPRLKSHNIKINFYYADEVELVDKLYNAGIDFILVNDVEKILNNQKKDYKKNGN